MLPSSACLPAMLPTYIDQLTSAIGAGIGGLALAIALHKKGISFTLYEDAAEFSAVG